MIGIGIGALILGLSVSTAILQRQHAVTQVDQFTGIVTSPSIDAAWQKAQALAGVKDKFGKPPIVYVSGRPAMTHSGRMFSASRIIDVISSDGQIVRQQEIMLMVTEAEFNDSTVSEPIMVYEMLKGVEYRLELSDPTFAAQHPIPQLWVMVKMHEAYGAAVGCVGPEDHNEKQILRELMNDEASPSNHRLGSNDARLLGV